MLPAAFALLAGLNAGLQMLGLPSPVTATRLIEVHGMLLILGFVGTLVSLERATALNKWYGFLVPALLGIGGVLLALAPVPLIVGKLVLVAATAGFTLLYLPLWRRQYDATLLTQLLGAALALSGSIIWISQPTFEKIVPWLIAFIVLTIAAERVELARINMGPGSSLRLLVHAWLITATLVIGLVSANIGAILLGIVLLSLVAWLFKNDVARNTIRSVGVTRFMAASILMGYFWLTIAAIILLFGEPVTRHTYDAVLHAVFLGYTFSMIMAHANIILPAVLRISLPYRPAFWAPVILLQVALVLRIGFGDGLDMLVAWQLGGALGVAALILFFMTAITSAIMGPPKKSADRSVRRIASGGQK